MSSPATSADEIAEEIAETRNRLAGTIDELVYRVHPQTILQRQLASLKGAFVNPDGSPRIDRIAKVAGITVGVVGLIVVLRKVAG